MSPSSARVALAVVAVVAAAGLAAARTTSADQLAAPSPPAVGEVVPSLPVLDGPAPEVIAEQWLNTDPLTPSDLAGKVVLYDFWTFGCINCRHTLPFVRAMHGRYAADGLVVLSVHTPEFAYEAEPDAVAAFVAENDITFPVALDPEKRIWRSFENHYWPAFYLHDRDGDRRYTHFGEGAYDQSEAAIRTLLGVDPNSPWAVVE